MADDFTDYATAQAVHLETLDPEAPLDDLEPLADLLRGARVVAIGENAHLVREFYLFRHRMLRFLTERCGFTAFGMESGFSEGLAVGRWVRGGPGDVSAVAFDGISYTMGRCEEMHDQLSWMRAAGVAFHGIDVPGSTATPLLALADISRYLEDADADALPVVDAVVREVEKYAGEHALPAFAAYGRLDRATRNEITAVLAELATRFDALRPAYGATEAFEVARHELRLVVLLDQALRGYATRETAPPKVAARDLGMAESVRWLLDRHPKLVVGAHNSHIQRTPVVTPAFSLSAMGHHLATALGDAYVTIAVTSLAGRTSAHRADPAAPSGVAIHGVDIEPPAAGSIEAALTGLQALDLRPARGRTAGPTRIRMMDSYQDAPILDAYDLVVVIPRTTTTRQVPA